MKITILITQDLDSPAGIGRYYPLAKGLVKLGHKVTIVALHANYKTQKVKRFERDGIEILYVGQMHVQKLGNQKTYYPPHKLAAVVGRATFVLSRAALTTSADIIHVGKPHPMNGIAGLLAHYIRGKCLFVDCDDYEVASGHFSNPLEKWIVDVFEKLIPRKADHITTHTTFLQILLQSWKIPPERVTYLPNGVDPDRFSPPHPDLVENLRLQLGINNKKVIAFIGSLSSPTHPVKLLLDAFALVKKIVPEAVLLIVGGGDEYDGLVNETEKMGIRNHTIFSGRVPADKVSIYYRISDVLVDPVCDDLVGRSRVPLKMFESWASGVPFVTADVGDRRLLMGLPAAGLLSTPGDPESLAQSLQQVLSNSELAHTLKERGYERVKEYSWDKLAERLEKVYLYQLNLKKG